VKQLMKAAQSSTNSLRDSAIVAFMLDTGCRASELISIRIQDLDVASGSCRVIGKGNKQRNLYFGSRTAAALKAYINSRTDVADRSGNEDAHEAGREVAYLFVSGADTKAMTRSGLLQVTRRLGRGAGIRTSCSPHAFRRTFAVQTLRNGANVFSVQAMLGHSNLQMTRRYCALAQTDVEAQHRQFSPLDRL
jgi:site-specific recombinase XerD